MTVCLYFGDRDECVECGGSASLGGTQEPLVTETGRYCSVECGAEYAARSEESRRLHDDWCRACGWDRHEHADDCAAPPHRENSND